MSVYVTWKNKMSGETGYVKAFKLKEGHIVSTMDRQEAKTYVSESAVSGILTKMEKAGIEQQNFYSIHNV